MDNHNTQRTDDRRKRNDDDGPPPFLGTWRNLYLGVIAILVIIMILVYVFSRFFS